MSCQICDLYALCNKHLLLQVMTACCRFLYDGQQIKGHETPAEVGIEVSNSNMASVSFLHYCRIDFSR